MKRIILAALFISTTAFAGPELTSGPSVLSGTPMTGVPCTVCHGKLDITDVNAGLGDLTREADAGFSDWGAGSVKLSCDDGTNTDVVSLALEPYDLENEVDLQDLTLPDVDLEATGLSCELQVDDGTDSINIVVDIL